MIEDPSKALEVSDDFKEEVFDYLDDLRDEGITNMFGARPYIESTFGLDKTTSIL